jgi:hypothetical protein
MYEEPVENPLAITIIYHGLDGHINRYEFKNKDFLKSLIN